MSSFLMSFYVRIKVPENGSYVLISLNDLEMSIKDFLRNTQRNLKEENNEEIFTIIRDLFQKTQILCWNKPCSLDSLFADLLSKVEKIDGKEGDIFELRFN